MSIAPEQITETLLQSINRAWESTSPPTDLELAALRREARKLCSADACMGHFCLGAISALEMDADGLHNEVAKAKAIRMDFELFMNYAVALGHLGLHLEAAAAGLQASKLQPENLTALEETICWHIWSGQLTKAAELRDTYLKRAPNQEIPNGMRIEIHMGALKKAGLTEADLVKANEVAFGLLLENKIRYVGIVFGEDDDEEIETAHLQIKIRASVEKAHELDLKLGERLIKALPEVDVSQLYVCFEPVFDHERGEPRVLNRLSLGVMFE